MQPVKCFSLLYSQNLNQTWPWNSLLLQLRLQIRGCFFLYHNHSSITVCGMETRETHNHVGRKVLRRRKQKKKGSVMYR
ncbi:hypothetical protein RchiOBHm_Chr5g0036551 [Rosa chinensis]|uniref:Uncharacterized protein n=1 Tax=Rosa chinensis TaxID=74649 RepID=A0A2P6QBI0_ROSCH|nr:hypothetical protein RchiOBHm_Chr5g0036551 [Rosa chinensis]